MKSNEYQKKMSEKKTVLFTSYTILIINFRHIYNMEEKSSTQRVRLFEFICQFMIHLIDILSSKSLKFIAK